MSRLKNVLKNKKTKKSWIWINQRYNECEQNQSVLMWWIVGYQVASLLHVILSKCYRFVVTRMIKFNFFFFRIYSIVSAKKKSIPTSNRIIPKTHLWFHSSINLFFNWINWHSNKTKWDSIEFNPINDR